MYAIKKTETERELFLHVMLIYFCVLNFVYYYVQNINGTHSMNGLWLYLLFVSEYADPISLLIFV